MIKWFLDGKLSRFHGRVYFYIVADASFFTSSDSDNYFNAIFKRRNLYFEVIKMKYELNFE